MGREGGREWGRERGGGNNSRRLGDMEEEAGKWERNNWGTQGLPEVKGNWISMWSQPSIFFFPGASKTRRRKQQRGEGAGVGDPVIALLPILLRQPLPTFSGCNMRWSPSAPPPWATPACTGRQVLNRVCLCVCIQVWGWAGGVLPMSTVSQPWLSV